jgi:hypothetical protein
MVTQTVRNVAQEEEPESVGSVVEIAGPRYEPDQPDGNDDNRGKPGVEGKLEAFKLPRDRSLSKALDTKPTIRFATSDICSL